MNCKIPDDKRLVDMTAGELRILFSELSEAGRRGRVLRGLPGLMEIFKCSRSKAMRIKASGAIDAAISQECPGGAFYVDEELALRHYMARFGPLGR